MTGRPIAAFLAGCAVLFAIEPGAALAASTPSSSGSVPGHSVDVQAERYVDALLRKMTLEEKVGQMLQADISTASPDDVRDFGLGSVLAGGSSAPNRDVRGPVGDWLGLTRAYAEAAMVAPKAAHQPIPLLFGIDAVHGHGHARGATIFPHNIALGAGNDPDLVRQIGSATAAEVAATGIDWVFAPTVAIAQDPRWGRTYESYSEDPALAARLGAALTDGLQRDLARTEGPPAGTVATLKHFLGDGATLDGRDQGETQSDDVRLQQVHGAGYVSGIQAGALSVMVSYSSWRGVKVHANRVLVTDLLKKKLGFDGLVISDWNGYEQIPGCTKFDCPAVVLAGVDMIMAADGWRQFREHMLAEVRDGTIPRARIDDAVRRILRVKYRAGLFARGSAATRTSMQGLSVIGAPAHRALAREAVRRSLVLLKNTGHTLPIEPGSRVLVAGAAADDVGIQCGGWTVDWQGDHNRNEDFPNATSILAGLREAVARGGGSIEYSSDGTYKARPDVAVVVFGERPYAEFDGDREALLLRRTDAHGLALLRRYRSEHIPTVAVLLSGRPLWVNRELNASSAFVAGWLPGSEGGGIADVLVAGPDGRPRFDFVGRLPFPWPATARPLVNDVRAAHGALFGMGYGLTYADRADATDYAEDAGVPPEAEREDLFLYRNHVPAPWTAYLRDEIAELRVTLPDVRSEVGALRWTMKADGAHVVWDGSALAELVIAGRSIDLRAAARSGSAIELTYRVDRRPSGRVRLGLRCSAPYGEPTDRDDGLTARRCGLAKSPVVDRTDALAQEAGTWRRLQLPLRCLTDAGADLARVGAPLVLQTEGRLALTLRDVRVVEDAAVVDCASIRSAADIEPAVDVSRAARPPAEAPPPR